MLKWLWIRLREGTRWIFRGVNFTKIERDLHVIAAPLAYQAGQPKAQAKVRARVKHLISCLPPEHAERFHEMMDRYGHSVRK